jgi:hypothetical protein
MHDAQMSAAVSRNGGATKSNRRKSAQQLIARPTREMIKIPSAACSPHFGD